MQQLAFYLIKVIACTGILLLYYKLALQNKRFHYYFHCYSDKALLTSHLEWR